MSKKAFLSALLISNFGLSTPFATDLKEADTATSAQGHTVMKFTSNSKNIPQRALGINDQTCEGFPFARTAENNADHIVIRNSILPVIDTWFFQRNKDLKKVSFEGSTINLTPFEGHTFLDGCDAIETVSFKGTTGVDLATFLEQYASITLLQRIIDGKCKLIIDMAETGKTMANLAQNGLYSDTFIHGIIRTYKFIDAIEKEKASPSASAAAKGWVSTLTFGFFGQ